MNKAQSEMARNQSVPTPALRKVYSAISGQQSHDFSRYRIHHSLQYKERRPVSILKASNPRASEMINEGYLWDRDQGGITGIKPTEPEAAVSTPAKTARGVSSQPPLVPFDSARKSFETKPALRRQSSRASGGARQVAGFGGVGSSQPPLSALNR